MALITNKKEENTYLRDKGHFYVAGWVANREGNNAQEMPKDCKGDKVIEKWHEEYLQGYGDSFANGECLMNR